MNFLNYLDMVAKIAKPNSNFSFPFLEREIHLASTMEAKHLNQ